MVDNMNVLKTNLKDALIFEPQVYNDERGFFQETWNEKLFNQAVGREVKFVQDNHSRSVKGVLRGLHYQYLTPQGKLVRVINGRVIDVAVDLRQSSPTYGQHIAIELSSDNKRLLWIPEGFAHGFLALSDNVDFLYKTSDYYDPSDEHCILWSDPSLNIDWLQNTDIEPILSDKDQRGVFFQECVKFV